MSKCTASYTVLELELRFRFPAESILTSSFADNPITQACQDMPIELQTDKIVLQHPKVVGYTSLS